MSLTVPKGFDPMAQSGDFALGIGPFYEKRTGRGWRFGLRVEQRHTIPTGVAHGGLVMTFLDHVLGKLVWEALGDRIAATVSLNVDLLAAARPGDWIEAEGEVTRKSSSLVFVRGRAYSGEETLATANGVWKVLGPK
jgi:acyl-coenzyme A thioesterase PaaI-like protein